MKFFDDPSEIDELILSTNGYINAEAWGLVSDEFDLYLEIIRRYLAFAHDKNPDRGFDILYRCKTAVDVSHARGLSNEQFRRCLANIFNSKESLLNPDQDFLHLQVEQLRQELKEAAFTIGASKIWQSKKLAKKLEKNTKGLKEGSRQPKGLISLETFIKECLAEDPLIKGFKIITKLRNFTWESPYEYGDFTLEFDQEADTIYQVDQKTGKRKQARTKQIYEYLKRVKQEQK